MERRGQISVFVILGVVILLIGGIWLFYLLSSTSQSQTEQGFEEDTAVINRYVEGCLDRSAYEGIMLLGKQGGYTEVPISVMYKDTSYWYLDTINLQPSLNETLTRLSSHVLSSVKECVNFTTFESRGYNVETGAPMIELSFNLNDYSAKLNYPINISKGRSSKRFDLFTKNYNIRYRKAFEVASQIVNKQYDPKFDFYNPLLGVDTNDFVVNYESFEDDKIIYHIKDTTAIGGEFELSFANRFKVANISMRVPLAANSNTVPVITPIVASSVDQMAKLEIASGTTIELNGQAVKEIKISQINQAKAGRFNLTTPIYKFEPSGLKFSEPQKVVIYWDEEKIPHQGEIGILHSEDGVTWIPLESQANYEQNYVTAMVDGFSYFTLVFEGEQQTTIVSGEASVCGTSDSYEEATDPTGTKSKVYFIPAVEQTVVLTLDTPSSLGHCHLRHNGKVRCTVSKDQVTCERVVGAGDYYHLDAEAKYSIDSNECQIRCSVTYK